jgi:ubiquitin carboxyl-terminal hydrolase 7
MNSLLQTLFIIKAFRRAVYLMPTNIEDFKSIPFCLQRIFYNLQTGKEPVRTFELLNAFGWSQREMNQQHDVNEFFLVLSDTLEKQMRNTKVNGTYSKLFEGISENVIQCLNVDYESSRKETFNCL